MAVYMQYPGVVGDVTESAHKNWIELTSFSWNIGRNLSSTVGSGADRESTLPRIGEVVVSKHNDAASVGLLTQALQGTGQTVIIDFTRTYKGDPVVYLELTLSNTIISGYNHEAGAERPTEELSLNFTKVEYRNTPMEVGGAPGSPSSVPYDLTNPSAS